MAEESVPNRFRFEDPTYGFMNDHPGAVVTDASADPTQAQSDVGRQQFYRPPTTSAWEFRTSPAYDNINPGTSTAPPSQPGPQTTAWPLPIFDQSESGGFNFNGFTPADVNSNVAFGAAVPTDNLNDAAAHKHSAAAAMPEAMSPAFKQKLCSIAMPTSFPYNSPKSASSPESARSDIKGGHSSSPEQIDSSTKDSRKRKVSSEPEDEDEGDDEDKPIKKTAHNMIEKRYRTNINDKIAALRDSVPSLRIMSKSARGEDTTEDREELHGLTPAHKLNKATVLSKATEYIRHLEKRNGRLMEENAAMQSRIAAFEKLFMAGAMHGSISPMQHPPTPMQYTHENTQPFNGSPMPTPQSNGTPSPAGMIQVPDDMKRIISAQMAAGQPYAVPQQTFRGANTAMIRQQQIQQQQQQAQQNNWIQGHPYYGKMMVGSLAGLMLIEAIRESETSNEEPQGRGLFALPIRMLGSLASSLDVRFMGYHALTSLKTLLLLGTFLWIFVPSLFADREDKNKKPSATVLRKAPPLASSIHLRRQAWLTAIQTVWVPRHNFLLEAAALILKTMKLSLRNVIGPHGFQMLTGLTPEQEVARVQAWSIALDSQLAGGDVDVCTSRLVLTLLASGTLPDSPTRLMLKALHIRVLLWHLTSSRLVQSTTNAVAAKMARSRWNEARQLNQLLIQTRKGSAKPPHEDELPDHLAVLVEQDCDAVLSHQVIQRAHNLCFNMETTYKVVDPMDGMDSVVDDVAIKSPLDAAAAWHSTQMLHRVLSDALDRDAESASNPAEDLDIAIRLSPVGSYAQLRATLARAVLVKQSRSIHIETATQTLGIDRSPDPLARTIFIVGHGFDDFSLDFSITLRCAKTIALIERAQERSEALRDVEALNNFAKPEITSSISLLGFTSIMQVMERLLEYRKSDDRVEPVLEKLASTLRLWMGGQVASRCGVESQLRQDVVERCLVITQSLVGMEIDTGYGSMSEDEEGMHG